jgi:tRNA threonylcarbamoyl adenosine modification protein YeaZ
MTKILTIDTSSKKAAISYSIKGEIIDDKVWTSKNNHSIELSENVLKLFSSNKLKVNDLDFISVALGPGGFTAIRVGISFAMGLSKFSNIKILGIPTFEIEFEKNVTFKKNNLTALIPAGFNSYCWKSIDTISERNVDGIFIDTDMNNIFKKGSYFCGEDTIKLKEKYPEFNFFEESQRTPKLMVNLTNKIINEKKQEKYYDLIPIYSRLPNITKKKESK